MNKYFIVFCAILFAGCTDEDSSHRALMMEGYSDIRFTGYSYFACSKDDTFHTGFTATNSKGMKVSGTVCCGMLKSCTIRW